MPWPETDQALPSHIGPHRPSGPVSGAVMRTESLTDLGHISWEFWSHCQEDLVIVYKNSFAIIRVAARIPER